MARRRRKIKKNKPKEANKGLKRRKRRGGSSTHPTVTKHCLRLNQNPNANLNWLR